MSIDVKSTEENPFEMCRKCSKPVIEHSIPELALHALAEIRGEKLDALHFVRKHITKNGKGVK